MQITKANGDVVEFDRERVLKSILRTGASQAIAENTLSRVEPQIEEGMSTLDLYALVRKELAKESVCFSCRYDLREAILKLGPAGFRFEKYVASILRAYRYDATNPFEDLPGACTKHEVDVVAEKEGRHIFIEAKFRNKYSDNVDLKDTMATWSRFLDLVDGSAIHSETPHFSECWIVTNARFSDRAKQFGDCKGIKLVGWNHPPGMTFASMVSHVSLYPVTVIGGLKESELKAFSENNLMLCREVAEMTVGQLAHKLGFSEKRAIELIDLSERIVEGRDK